MGWLLGAIANKVRSGRCKQSPIRAVQIPLHTMHIIVVEEYMFEGSRCFIIYMDPSGFSCVLLGSGGSRGWAFCGEGNLQYPAGCMLVVAQAKFSPSTLVTRDAPNIYSLGLPFRHTASCYLFTRILDTFA